MVDVPGIDVPVSPEVEVDKLTKTGGGQFVVVINHVSMLIMLMLFYEMRPTNPHTEFPREKNKEAAHKSRRREEEDEKNY